MKQSDSNIEQNGEGISPILWFAVLPFLGTAVFCFMMMLDEKREEERYKEYSIEVHYTTDENLEPIYTESTEPLFIITNNHVSYDSLYMDCAISAEQGDVEAQYLLGVYFANGIGVEQNKDEAIKWYNKAAENGHDLADYYLNNRKGFYAQIEEILKKQPKSQSKMEKSYTAEQIAELQKYADSGDEYSQYELGRCYFYGNNVTQDYNKAAKLFSKLAQQGHTKAQNYLGGCYEKGLGVEQNDSKAISWFKNASKDNFVARYNLGLCYYYGKYGVPQDKDLAIKHIRQSVYFGMADIGYPRGALFLGKHFNNEGNYKTAFYHFSTAANYNCTDALLYIGQYYEKGKNVNRNISTAFEWYLKSAEQLNPKALNYLGVCFHRGQIVERDYQLALKLFSKATESLDCRGEGFFNIGKSYELGCGVDKDMDKAMKYYHKAHEKGCDDATLYLVEIYEKGDVAEKDYDKSIKLLKGLSQK